MEEDQASSTVGFRCAMDRVGSPEGNGRKNRYSLPQTQTKLQKTIKLPEQIPGGRLKNRDGLFSSISIIQAKADSIDSTIPALSQWMHSDL